MRFRFKAFAAHLSGSALALTLILGSLYAGWYRWPGWYLTGVLRVLVIVAIVDLAIGPTLTLLIANPRKPRRELTRDIAIIVTVQIGALVYGAATLWQGRPLYYTFSVDRLEMVQASDITDDERRLALSENAALAPRWYSRPRFVFAPLPDDPAAANAIVQSAVFGSGQDVIDMPRYFKPWPQGLSRLRTQLSAVDAMNFFSKDEKRRLTERLARLGASSGEHNALVLWGGSRKLLAVFNPATLDLRAVLRPD